MEGFPVFPIRGRPGGPESLHRRVGFQIVTFLMSAPRLLCCSVFPLNCLYLLLW